MAVANEGALSAAGVYLVRPDRVECGGAEAVVGRGGYALLAAMERGTVTVRGLTVRLWGLPESRPSKRLRQAVYRANKALESVGAGVRVRFDGGDVVLV